jgi:AraC-like DNA-binding protein
MPSSAVRSFSDADDYAAAIRNSKVELTVTGRGPFRAKLIRIDLHHLWMQRFSESLPRIVHSAIMVGRPTITFRTQPGPSLLWSGVELQPINVTRHSDGESAHQLSSGSASFGAMSLPVEKMVSVGAVIAGCDLTPPRDPLLITPQPAAMAKLQWLHAAAGQLAEEAPGVIADPDAAHGLEQALIEAMARCLGEGGVDADRVAQRQHELIMRRFRRVLEESSGQPLYIPEICAVIRVAGRTLRVCCHEHLGMGPKRYLLLRRMHLARRALREAAPGAAGVTEIATRYGFWQFGRFAVEYRSLFGETPSATLHRPPR